MTNRSKSAVILAAFGAIALLASSAQLGGCQQKRAEDCEKPAPDDERCRIVRKAPADPPKAAAQPATPGAKPAASQGDAAVPGLPLASLTPAQRSLFWSVVEDQFDPCGKPQSFGARLRGSDREGCPLAWSVARWVVGRAKAGDERRQIVWGLLERLRREHHRATFRLEGRPRHGPAEPRATVVEFYDYGCPYCRELEPALTKLRDRHPDVAFVLKQCPLEQHAGADRAALAVVAAARQGRAWPLHRALFAAPSLDDDDILAAAKAAGLDLERFRADLEAEAVATIVREDLADADAALVQGTPTFFVDGVEVAFDELDGRLREARAAPAGP